MNEAGTGDMGATENAGAGASMSRRALLMGAAATLGGCVGLRRGGSRVISGVRLGGHDGPVSVVAIAEDSRLAVTADAALTPRLHVWDLRTRRRTHTMLAPGAVRAMALIEERNAVVVAGWNVRAQRPFLSVLELETGQQVRELSESGVDAVPVDDLHALGDARVLASHASVTESAGSTLWDCDSGAVIRRSPYAADALAADRRSALAGHEIWDLETTVVRARLPGSGASSTSSTSSTSWGRALSADGSCAVIDDVGGAAGLWTDDGARVRTFDDQPRGLWSAAFSRDGRFLLTASDLPPAGPRRGAIVLRDAQTGRAMARLPGHRDHPRAVAFSPDTRFALTADRGGAVYLWTLNL
jgi:WD40 repeat protein